MNDKGFFVATALATLAILAGIAAVCEMMPISDAEVYGTENGDVQWKFQTDGGDIYHVNCYIKNGEDLFACTTECGWITVEQSTVVKIYVLDNNKEWVLP